MNKQSVVPRLIRLVLDLPPTYRSLRGRWYGAIRGRLAAQRTMREDLASKPRHRQGLD